jgi:4a-hydroxytetrahydrobiopterin dehydratase
MKSEDTQKTDKSGDAAQTRLTGKSLQEIHAHLAGGWKVADEQRLEKTFKFPDFKTALEFTNRVGEIAEQQGHHPDIFLTYGEVRLQIWSHKAGGLTKDDFTLAGKVNDIK